MQNNKYYLERLSVPTLLTAIFGLSYVITPLFFSNDITLHDSVLVKIVYSCYHLFFFASIGYITKNWQAAITAILVATIMQLLSYVIFKGGYSLIQFLYYELILLVSSMFFLYLLERKLPAANVLFISVFLLLISTQSYVATQLMTGSGYVNFLGFTIKTPSVLYGITVFISISLPFFIKLLFFTEIINYYKGHGFRFKPRLLNLGNHYPSGYSLMVLLVLNLGMLFCFAKGFELIKINLFYNSPPAYFPKLEFKGMYGSMYKNSLLIIPFFLLYGWYYRKFLLEYFINNGQSSKFLFWLCCIPVIGVIALLIITESNRSKHTHREKRDTLSEFAASNSMNVLVILAVVLVLRSVIAVLNGNEIQIFASLISILLLYLTSISREVWRFCLWLNILVMAGVIIASLFFKVATDNPFSLVLGLIAVNTISLVMLFTVFHIGAFEYTPDFDPDDLPGTQGDDLFPEYSRYK